MNTLKEIVDVLNKHQQLVITGHINPDGDCLGSMLALGTALKYQGKKVRMILEGPLPESLEILKDEWDYIFADDFTFEAKDTIVLALDSGDTGRLPKMPEHWLPVVNIDHHLSNAMYGTYNHVNESAAAAGEIIYDLINEMGVEIDKRIAYYIAIAIITDTGCFRYSNTNPKILRIIANFVEMGIDTTRIFKDFIGTHSLAKIRLKGLVYSRMNMALNGRVAWIVIDQKLLGEAGATLDDAGHLSGELRDVKGVEVGFTILQTEPGVVQLGFRSNYIVPVNIVAQTFGGGGHLRASGATFAAEINGLPEKIIAEIAKYLE